jgi:hypothetical protein
MRALLSMASIVAVGAMGTGVAAAGGPPTINRTRHVVNETQTFKGRNPCTGVRTTITITFSGVEHFTLFDDGTVHATDTEHGTFSFDANPPDGVADATGRFTSWDGANGLLDRHGNFVGRGEESFILNGDGTNADGSTFHFHNNGHVRADQFGNVVQEFFDAHCH